MTQQRTTCVWCGDPAGSAEHLVPRWLSKEFGVAGPGSGTRVASAFTLGGPPQVGYTSGTKSVANIVTRRVCTTCNNGWMSILEKSAMTSVLSLAKGSGAPSSAQTSTLRAWGIARALVVGLHPRSDYGPPDRAHYERFYRERDLPRARVLLARSVDRSDVSVGYAPFAATMRDGTSRPMGYYAVIGAGEMIMIIIHVEGWALPRMQWRALEEAGACEVLSDEALAWPPAGPTWTREDRFNPLGVLTGYAPGSSPPRPVWWRASATPPGPGAGFEPA